MYCKTCKYWVHPDGYAGIYGICNRIPQLHTEDTRGQRPKRVFSYDEDGNEVWRDDEPACTSDADSYASILRCADTFGCVLHTFA